MIMRYCFTAGSHMEGACLEPENLYTGSPAPPAANRICIASVGLSLIGWLKKKGVHILKSQFPLRVGISTRPRQCTFQPHRAEIRAPKFALHRPVQVALLLSPFLVDGKRGSDSYTTSKSEQLSQVLATSQSRTDPHKGATVWLAIG